MSTPPRAPSGRAGARLRASAIALAVAVAALGLWHAVVLSPHLIESGDLLQPLSMRALRTLFWPFWNAIFEFPNIETAGRLAWMAPFLALPDTHLAQQAMIAAAVIAAAWSMLFAGRRLGAAWLVAAVAAVLYAFTPWAVIRLQHYFLLPGYAALPAILALWIRPLRRGTAWAQAALLTAAATTPHYLAFSWGLSLAWLLLYPRPRHLRLMLATALRFLALNVIWLLPTALYALRADLVPSLPNWELEATFSRAASLASVARLGGYWWPLASVELPAWLAPLGWGLVAAAAAGAWCLPRGRRLLLATAVLFGVLALGTRLPWLFEALTLNGPLAARLGWLFRDPNKAVGPLAAALFLLAAGASGGRRGGRSAAWTVALLLAYGAYAVPWSSRYLADAYGAHAPPGAFERVNAWLDGRPGRVLWLPRYNGAQALWNGDNLTPEVAEYSSRAPALDSYGYDPRARRAFQALVAGSLAGPFTTDVAATLRLWGTRWLVHHRDLAPLRAQPPGTFDNGVERLPGALENSDLRLERHDAPLYVYDAGDPVGAFVAGTPLLSEHALAATLTLQALHAAPTGLAVTEVAHPGTAGLALLPGDDPRVLLAHGVRSVDLAAATVHFDPAARWSRLPESDPEWAPRAVAAGLPAGSTTQLVLTRARGAELSRPLAAPAGRYRVLLRAYASPRGGALEVSVAGGAKRVLSTVGTQTRSLWHDLGQAEVSAASGVTLVNLGGENAVSALALVPVDSWAQAVDAAASTPTAWLWPSSALCTPARSAAPAKDLRLAQGLFDLPWQASASDGEPWRAYDALRVDLLGDGSGRTVEAWTRVAGTWVLVGTVDLWWQGWRKVRVPVSPENFASAPTGADAPVGLVRLLAPGSAAATVRARNPTMVADRSCTLTLWSPDATAAVLRGSVDGPAVDMAVNGTPLRLVDGGPVPIALRAGVNVLTVPRDRAAGIRSAGVMTAGLDPASPGQPLAYPDPQPRTPIDRRAELPCASNWRLAVTDALYVPGLHASVGGTRVAAVPVDHLRLGAWVPAGVCGTLRVENDLSRVASAAALATLVAVALLAAFDATRGRRGPAR